MEQFRLHADESHNRVAAKAPPIQHQSRIMRGGRHPRHRHLRPVLHGLAPKAGAHHVIEMPDGFVFGLQPKVPIPLRLLVERRLHGMGANIVVNLPGNQLRMLPQSLGHGADDLLGILPVKIVIEAASVPGALAQREAPFIGRKNVRMLMGQPDGRGGGRSGQDDFDVFFAHQVHEAPEPGKVEFTLARFTQAPDELPHPHDVHAGGHHQFNVLFPASLRIFRSARVGVDPMFRVIIGSEIHTIAMLTIQLHRQSSITI